MKRIVLIILFLLSSGAVTRASGPVPPYTTTYMRTVLDDADSATARTTLEILLTEFCPLLFSELSADPAKPAEGHTSIWMSDGTGFGDDGDLIIAATAGGVTKRAVLWDFSAADEWIDFLLLETGNILLLETADKLILE